MSKSEKSIKQDLDEFESIVQWFDSDDVDIEKAITKYEEGVALAEEIKKRLETEKNRIEILSKKFDD